LDEKGEWCPTSAERKTEKEKGARLANESSTKRKDTTCKKGGRCRSKTENPGTRKNPVSFAAIKKRKKEEEGRVKQKRGSPMLAFFSKKEGGEKKGEIPHPHQSNKEKKGMPLISDHRESVSQRGRGFFCDSTYNKEGKKKRGDKRKKGGEGFSPPLPLFDKPRGGKEETFIRCQKG